MSENDPALPYRPVAYTAAGFYSVQPAARGGGAAPACLVALHGWGQNAGSFLKRFRVLADRPILVVAVQGPHPHYLDLATKKVGFTWLTAFERDRAVETANTLINACLDDITLEHPFDPARLFVLGFSQGVPMAYRFAQRGGRPVAGVIACGGDLAPDAQARLATGPRFPVLLVHGESDDIVPPSKMEEARENLVAAGVDVDVYPFPEGHDIPEHAAAKIGTWIEAR